MCLVYCRSCLDGKTICQTRRVQPFRGNPWRHFAIPRDLIVRCMRLDGIGI